MNDPMTIRYALILVFLIICTISDIVKRRVYFAVLVVSALISLSIDLIFQDISLLVIIGGVAIGLTLLGISFASREKIGMGDAFVITVCGLCLGFAPTVSILIMSIFIAGFARMIAMFFLHKPKDYGLPFIPFVLGAFAIYVSFSFGFIERLI